MSAEPRRLRVGCAISGGGPAGMMLGLLLARAGIEIAVLEKHADFLRDFRGDTIHPSTLTVLHELGLATEFLALPHQRIDRAGVRFGDREITVADFSRLSAPFPFIALIPQWDFLDFLAGQAARWPGFRLLMETESVGLIEESGEVMGLAATGPDGPVEIRADLTVAADGRHSALRAAAGLPLADLGAPIDVFWMRVPRSESDPAAVLASVIAGRLVVLIYRGDYWQCAYVIEKGAADAIRARGLPAFRAELARAAPFLGDRVDALGDWDGIKLLTVAVNRLERWQRPGFLAIGDAAHAMSPVGGVGINLAIQDAVAAANLLWAPLSRDRPAPADLARVETRRRWPTRIIQRAQVLAHRNILRPALETTADPAPPLALRLLDSVPALRGLAARAIGMGPRPEHVHSPER